LTVKYGYFWLLLDYSGFWKALNLIEHFPPPALLANWAEQDCLEDFLRVTENSFYSNLLAWTKKNWRILGATKKYHFYLLTYE
jgi:hypothetical protein